MEKVRPWCGQPSNRGRLKTNSLTNGVGLHWFGLSLSNVRCVDDLDAFKRITPV